MKKAKKSSLHTAVTFRFLESRDPEVRKNAFNAVYETYRNNKNTIGATLSANINKNIFYAKARKYPSVLECHSIR